MNFNIITLGCKVNQYESQAMREAMLKNGFQLSESKDKADIIIINSCTVTSVSDAKNRKIINRARRYNPNSIIVLTGCMPQAFPDSNENFKNCDIVLGNARRSELIPTINKYISERERIVAITKHPEKNEDYENLSISSLGEHTRAFIKIEDGCNRFCSYCIIPYARGRVRSKSLGNLREEVEKVAINGYKEVVLVGINLSAYGLNEDFDLADAVECAGSVEGIERVRLGSIEPEQMDESLIRRLSKEPKFCPQFHLSLQSGCDKTLKNMNRHYTTREYAQIVQRLRNAFENSSITTDVMVGFAGESEEDFRQSMEFVKSIGFAKVHVFPYSQRKGTKAAVAPDQVNPSDKERRAALMGGLVEQSRLDFLKSQVGREEIVLVERLRNNYLEGYTANYTPVRINSTDAALCGSLCKVNIISVDDNCCLAELI